MASDPDLDDDDWPHDPVLQRRLAPSMQGMPEQLPLPAIPAPYNASPEDDGRWPCWRYFRWQPFEHRPIPWTGALAGRRPRGLVCGTPYFAEARFAQRVKAELAVAWEEHCRRLDRYLLAMAGQAPARLRAERTAAEPTPIEAWIATGRADLPDAPPVQRRHALSWEPHPLFGVSYRYVAVPPGVERLTDAALEPPVRLRCELEAVLDGLPAGWRVMAVYPPRASAAPPINVLLAGPPAWTAKWHAVHARMRDIAGAALPWADAVAFHAVVSGCGPALLDAASMTLLMRAAAELGYDAVHWVQRTSGAARTDVALLTRRAMRHAPASAPLPPDEVPVAALKQLDLLTVVGA
ncbi:hypothetical protein [Azospirillum sp.]|uniref:hypothetical protein n=1 Tax=Azospirillum sp. TaxID=34012 RepID=UPI002D5721EE|nr:hypothetical protein [Azospirillum sp.]HYD65561.1 hypothetical protein [Azospirillum sp.]